MKWTSMVTWITVVALGVAAVDVAAGGGDPASPTALEDAGAASSTAAGYPPELHGAWLPLDISCTTLDAAHSDALVVIQRDRLLGYETVHLIGEIERIAEAPAAWLVRSESSLGGDPPGESGNVLVLTGNQLAIAADGSATVYRKCR